MNTLIWHAAALLLATATAALVLVLGHSTLRSLGLALLAGAAVVLAMLAISSTDVLSERASAALTPTVVATGAVARRALQVRFIGTGWEVAARPVHVTMTAPGRWRPRAVRVMPDSAGRIDVVIAAPFAARVGCTVSAMQITILGALRASAPCEARPTQPGK